MKKFAPFIGVGVVIVVALIGIGVFAMSKKNGSGAAPTPTPTKKKVSKPVNQIPYEERPYVVMAPTVGREVDVTVVTVPKPADSVEYLAEYQYGTSLGGNEQFIDLKKGLPGTKEFALYSRSAGGKTSYEEDVMGGTLRLDFSGQNDYSLEQEWKYIDNKNKDTTFTTKDEKFSVSSKDLASVRYAILYNSPGLPAALEGTKVSEVFTYKGTSIPTSKKFDISIETTGNGEVSIMGWDGKAWKSYPAELNSGKATANVDVLEAYVVVNK